MGPGEGVVGVSAAGSLPDGGEAAAADSTTGLVWPAVDRASVAPRAGGIIAGHQQQHDGPQEPEGDRGTDWSAQMIGSLAEESVCPGEAA